jgi:hypothetical protein
MTEAKKADEAKEAANDESDEMAVPVGIRPPPPMPGIRPLARAASADAMAVIAGRTHGANDRGCESEP